MTKHIYSSKLAGNPRSPIGNANKWIEMVNFPAGFVGSHEGTVDSGGTLPSHRSLKKHDLQHPATLSLNAIWERSCLPISSIFTYQMYTYIYTRINMCIYIYILIYNLTLTFISMENSHLHRCPCLLHRPDIEAVASLQVPIHLQESLPEFTRLVISNDHPTFPSFLCLYLTLPDLQRPKILSYKGWYPYNTFGGDTSPSKTSGFMGEELWTIQFEDIW